ncbi:hypothetical protein BO86DRAFT_389952 [Aspergillus japonicus CBS 114.51]|uniref:Uncharacterized protein n=1 Tax=Aspergillus japonicus CBS 114.51 TaxID=1448312 RepID=A0A8T8WZC2_ASPJA|nr:hypothetical protein BO86DRAFT_389952 [Aspergillus japonicus CBS 114.51]RAH80990.1 hypothetical protein BO86DRAFT_389952 [Aspergillus japonicus CBS 114.51]
MGLASYTEPWRHSRSDRPCVRKTSTPGQSSRAVSKTRKIKIEQGRITFKRSAYHSSSSRSVRPMVDGERRSGSWLPSTMGRTALLKSKEAKHQIAKHNHQLLNPRKANESNARKQN